MDISALKTAVLKRIDEASADFGDIAPRFNIEEFLKDAANELMRTLPIHALPSVLQVPTTAVTKNADGSGYIELPDNFLRLVEFKMKGWLRPVFHPIQYGSKEYVRQSNRLLRGGPSKPIVAIIPTSSTKKRLEYFSVTTGDHVVEKATYVATTDPTQIPDALIDALCWLTASLVLAVANELEASSFTHNRYIQLISLM